MRETEHLGAISPARGVCWTFILAGLFTLAFFRTLASVPYMTIAGKVPTRSIYLMNIVTLNEEPSSDMGRDESVPFAIVAHNPRWLPTCLCSVFLDMLLELGMSSESTVRTAGCVSVVVSSSPYLASIFPFGAGR